MQTRTIVCVLAAVEGTSGSLSVHISLYLSLFQYTVPGTGARIEPSIVFQAEVMRVAKISARPHIIGYGTFMIARVRAMYPHIIHTGQYCLPKTYYNMSPIKYFLIVSEANLRK